MNVLIKLLGTLAGMGAGIAANKALESIWSKSTGKPAPKDATNLEDSLPGVILFALAGAGVGAVIHVLTQRTTKNALVKLQETASEV
ncbi:DUF4235 domain-containing protein [Arthrobacter sp. NA-172]|uniref:DUF4235 domain-containing protein n=1 Tax=Arthrobacter sp. NA-172 TaxID=3367524 RepID=UPI0037551D30